MFSGPIYRDDQLGVDHFKEFENQIDGWLQNNRDIVQARSLTNLTDTELICQLLQKIDPRSFSKYHKHVGTDVAKKNGNILAIGQFSFKLGVPFDFLLTTRDFELNNKKAFYKFLGVILYIGGVLTTWDCPAAILSKSFYFTNYLGGNLDLQVPDYTKLDSFQPPKDNMNFKLCIREFYPNWILTYPIAKDIRKQLRSIHRDEATLRYLAATSRSSSVASTKSNSRIPSRKLSFSFSNDQDLVVSSSQVINDTTKQFTAQSQILSASKLDESQNISQQAVLSKTKNFHSSLITDENPKIYGMENTFKNVIPKPPSLNDQSPPNKVIPIYSQNPNSNHSLLDNSFSTGNFTNTDGVNKSIHNESGVNKSIHNESGVNKSIHNNSGINSNQRDDHLINRSTRGDTQVINSITASNKINKSINKSSLQNTNPNIPKNTDITELDTEIEEISQDQYSTNNHEFDYNQPNPPIEPGNRDITNQDISQDRTDNGDFIQHQAYHDGSGFNDPSSISFIPDASQINDPTYDPNDPNDPNNPYIQQYTGTDGQNDSNNQYYNQNDRNDQYYNQNDPNDQYYNQNDPNDQYYNQNNPNNQYDDNNNPLDPVVTDYHQYQTNPDAETGQYGQIGATDGDAHLYITDTYNGSNRGNYGQSITQSGQINNYDQGIYESGPYNQGDNQIGNTEMYGNFDELPTFDDTGFGDDSNTYGSNRGRIGNSNNIHNTNPNSVDNTATNTANPNSTANTQPKPVEPSTCCLIY